MRKRQTLDDRGLADARLADEDGIVLGAPRQHLDRAADFLVAADDRIELAGLGRLGEIAGIFLQRVIGIFGRRIVGRAALAEVFDRGIEQLRGDPGIGEDAAGVAALFHAERQQQAFDRDVAVAGLLRDLLGIVEEPRRGRREIELAGPGALDLRAVWRARDRSAPRRRASVRPPGR